MADVCRCRRVTRISSEGTGLATTCVLFANPFLWQTAQEVLTAVRLEHLAKTMC
jgi:hypothetical protein